MMLTRFHILVASLLAIGFISFNGYELQADPRAKILENIGGKVGIVAVLDWPGADASSVMDLLKDNQLKIYFQSDDAKQVERVRKLASDAGVLGDRASSARWAAAI